jgi:NADH:ubiquinone oxidoreductase subunit F (NADH-binding)
MSVMMTTSLDQSPGYDPGSSQGTSTAAAPRLLPYGDRQLNLAEHLALHGPPAYHGRTGLLVDRIRQAGLTGRGGAAFPTHRKMAAVLAAAGKPIVVANGAEGEPAAGKDKTLLYANPHLVLDGLQLAAEAVGAHEAYLYVHRHERLLQRVHDALSQRSNAGLDRTPVTVVDAPRRFLAGQESALVHRIEGGRAIPRYTPRLAVEHGIGGAPTLVQNVETLANIALIARFGPDWFRAAGTPDEPGTMLVTIHLPATTPHIVEVAIGTPLRSLLDLSRQPTRAVLVGGYHGTWLPADRAAARPLTNAALRAEGAALGAGVLAALPSGRCGLRETAGILGYLAAESAGQCGPCLNGLPRIAHALDQLARPAPNPGLRETVEGWAGLVAGRGACHHPDGSMRLVRSALTVFAEELRLHASGVCTGPTRTPFLPLPAGSPRDDQDWS